MSGDGFPYELDPPRPGIATTYSRDNAQERAVEAQSHVAGLIVDAVVRELESEARGLLMAARMHGYELTIIDGHAKVTKK